MSECGSRESNPPDGGIPTRRDRRQSPNANIVGKWSHAFCVVFLLVLECTFLGSPSANAATLAPPVGPVSSPVRSHPVGRCKEAGGRPSSSALYAWFQLWLPRIAICRSSSSSVQWKICLTIICVSASAGPLPLGESARLARTMIVAPSAGRYPIKLWNPGSSPLWPTNPSTMKIASP